MTIQPDSRRSWLLAGGLGVVLLGGIGLMLATRPSDGTAVIAKNGATEPIAATPVESSPLVSQRSAEDRLAQAAMAVFGASARGRRDLGNIQNAGPAVERPLRILDLPFGPVLLTSVADPDACHACTGYLGAYYLRETPTGFAVTARYPEAASGSGWGSALEDWSISNTYTRYPAIVYDTGYMAQGTVESGRAIVELTPNGPELSWLATGLAAPAWGGVSEEIALEGRVTNVVRGRSLEVHFNGTCNITHRYVMRAGKFDLAEDLPLECPEAVSGKGSNQ